MSVERRRQMIEPRHSRLSVARQCELVSISRSGFYYQPAGETPLNLGLMRLIDEQFLEGLARWRALFDVKDTWLAASGCAG
jgi:putative transposase